MTTSVESSIREKSALSGSVPKRETFFLLENLVEQIQFVFPYMSVVERNARAHTL